jgi:hypothetical protein
MAVERRLTWPEWRQLLRDDAEFLLVAVPPLIALGISWLSPLDVFRTSQVILGLGTLTLAGWGLYAGTRPGCPRRALRRGTRRGRHRPGRHRAADRVQAALRPRHESGTVGVLLDGPAEPGL